MKIVIATIKKWNIDNAITLKKNYHDKHDIKIIDNPDDFNLQALNDFSPDYIFLPHWSYIIPKDIYNKFECIVFHMTDLPFGRGGSPLQNLIVRGIYNTKISAIRVVKGLDAGPIYMKENLELSGSAEEIYRRASKIIYEKMIPFFLEHDKLQPAEQQGEPVIFKRRSPEQSELKESLTLQQIYDYIRMLDAEGYPNAYLTFGSYKLSFKNAQMQDGKICAEVEIKENDG